ncbi:MAG: hypothetical protein ACYDH5_10525 [Acidimicrobiales bacterium]
MHDEEELAELFNRFARWQSVRASAQVVALAATLWALATTPQR